MLQKFKEWRPQKAAIDLITQANEIIEDYDRDGYMLTLRQLYYQFVSRNAIENSEKSYKRLGEYITRAREAGMLSWQAIEDRTRNIQGWSVNENPQELFEAIPYKLSVDMWKNQKTHIEVWIEKEALGNVLSRACRPYKLDHMPCKGYLSSSEMWRAGRRFHNAKKDGKKMLLIHLGDHDPSGIDMTRDNKDRLGLFSQFPSNMQVQRIALNMDQVEQYEPPPNPAKITDTRAKDYIKKFGDKSWELDALKPQVITDLVAGAVEPHIDWVQWKADEQREAELKSEARLISERWDDIVEYLKAG